VAEPKAFLAIAPVWLAFSLLGVPGIAKTWTLAIAIASNATALAACFGLLILARNTVFARREVERLSIAAVVGVGALIGVVKALLTVSLIALLGPDPTYLDMMPSRVLGAALTGAALLPLSAVFLAMRNSFLEERHALLQELSQSYRGDSLNYAAGLSEVATNVQAFLRRARTDLEEKKSRPNDLRDYLEKELHRGLRQLANELNSDKQETVMASSFRDMVATTVRARSYPLIGVAIAHALLITPFVFFQVGLQEALGRGAISTTLLVFVIWLMKVSPKGGLIRGVIVLTGGLTIWSIGNELIAVEVFGPMDDLSPLVTGIANTALAVLYTFALGALRVIANEQKTIRSYLDELLTEKYWQRDISTLQTLREKRLLAQQLHGRLQNVLLATLAQLKKDPDSLSFHDLDAELSSLSVALSKSEPGTEWDVTSLSEACEELSQRWWGILEVKINLTNLSLSPNTQDFHAILDVAEECISNAVRHGLATVIDIEVRADGSKLFVQAQDNGIGPRQGTPGLGSLLFSSLPGASWVLEENTIESGSKILVEWQARKDVLS
jgi:two-component sensor histidine kinase